MELPDFLRPRLDEAETRVHLVDKSAGGKTAWSTYLLADVAAKRRIVDEFGDAGEWLPFNREDDEPEYAYGRARALYDVLKLLAQSFADHPDFDPAWKVD